MKRLFLILVLAAHGWATTTVTGHVANLAGTPQPNTYVRFWLRGCNGNQPRAQGSAVVAPSQGNVFYFDIHPDNTGTISGTLYSTTGPAPTLSDIECGLQYDVTWYGVQWYNNGKPGPEIPARALEGQTLNLDTFVPITTTPVYSTPAINTGTFTYLSVTNGATINSLDGIIYVDGATYPTVQSAINALPTHGGTVIIPCSTSAYAGPTTIPSGVRLKAGCAQFPAAVLNTIVSLGGESANTVTFSYSSPLTISGKFGIELDGIVFDFGGNGGLTLDAISGSNFNMSVVNCKNNAPCLTLTATVSGLTSAINKASFIGTYGGSEGVVFNGTVDTGGGVVTGWNIDELQVITPSDASGNGTFVDFKAYADTNYINHALLSGCPANGATAVVHGVRFNSRSSAVSFGVYNNQFNQLDFNIGNTCGSSSSDELSFGVGQGNIVNIGVVGGAPNGMLDANNNPKVTFNGACATTTNCGEFIRVMHSIATNYGTADPQVKAMKFTGSPAVGPTAASVGATANATFNWNYPFSDLNYTATCSMLGMTNLPIMEITGQTASAIQVTIHAASAAAASVTTVECIARHDSPVQY